MRKSFVALLLLMGAAAFSANLALAAVEDGTSGVEGLKLSNAQMMQELSSRASRLGTSTGPNSSDTTFIGYTPGHFDASLNYWSVYSGFGAPSKSGYAHPIGGVAPGAWDFDHANVGQWGATGDSLQGWFPLRNIENGTGGQTREDVDRAWWAIEIGNTANYVSNQANGRTFGVNGVWHRDPGILGPAPGGLPSPQWSPLGGNASAWMGLRAHGDNTVVESKSGNPFNEDVLMYNGLNAVSASGNDKAFPGYGSQMDQILYRDYQIADAGANLTVSFKWRTQLSVGIGTTASTRTGWFDKDPTGVPVGGVLKNNYIASCGTCDATAPRDSFTVYVGAPVNDGDLVRLQFPLPVDAGNPLVPVYDKKHRWFAEVLHTDVDPGSPAANPQPRYYREILSAAGINATSTSTLIIPNGVLAQIYEKSTSHKIRLAFRVHTNRGFDDEGTAYSSNGIGAAVVDDVTLQESTGSLVAFGDFESATSIDNDVNTSALDAWKSTGKPPAIYHHVHSLDPLIYEDLCGQPGATTRICNMFHNVVSAGDHDNSEAAGGLVDGSADRERFDGMFSPTINLAGPYTGPAGFQQNAQGIYKVGDNGGLGDGDAGEDIYVAYDLYAGVFDLGTKGNEWRFGFMSYPANSKTVAALPGTPYKAWGQVRYPGFVIFNPDQQCFQDIVDNAAYANSLIETSNTTGIPDSLKFMVSKRQECFRFGLSTGCSPTDGCYWDNISLVIIDGNPAQLAADIWQWINDSFPANAAPGLGNDAIPGIAASFDTASAIVRTGLNTAPAPNTKARYDIPGDSTIVVASPTTARVDLVFRILQGPGGYTTGGTYPAGGRGDGVNGYIKRLPTDPNLASSEARTNGGTSFWEQYRDHPGTFASPNASNLHKTHPSGWDPNVWNSARCDTSEINVYAFQGTTGTVLGGPADNRVWMSTYHESDPHFNVLGITKPRCFVKTPTSSVQDIICDGTVPAQYAALPNPPSGFTKESTKIIPDGLLTCGAHVEYFFRDVKGTKNDTLLASVSGMLPDTNVVVPQIGEGSTDGHRWQEFGVLPDCWKATSYTHPVFRVNGRGLACMLVVDNNDRRGNERAWVSVADTIGATETRKWGAHNGWHGLSQNDGNVAHNSYNAIGSLPGTAVDLSDPLNNLNPGANQDDKTQARRGFVAQHGGQAGTSWDMYQVKASESFTTQAGTPGGRLVPVGAQPALYAQNSRQGPTPDMLDAYYKMVLWLSGDLNSGILGPFKNRAGDDVALITGWLTNGDPAVQNRGFWAIGDGFVESSWNEANANFAQLLSYLGVDLLDSHYSRSGSNSDVLIALTSLPAFNGKTENEIYGIRNVCLWTNDVLIDFNATLSQVAATYDKRVTFAAANKRTASVFHVYDPSEPWKSLCDGWDIEHLTGYDDRNTVQRSTYFNKIFTTIWAKLCVVPGTPILPLDVPNTLSKDDLVNFVNLRSANPMINGSAKIHFGLAKRDRVEAKVYDVGGRLVRTLTDREFGAGEYDLVWDGADNLGKRVPRGVYFTQIRFRNSQYEAARKLTVLE